MGPRRPSRSPLGVPYGQSACRGCTPRALPRAEAAEHESSFRRSCSTLAALIVPRRESPSPLAHLSDGAGSSRSSSPRTVAPLRPASQNGLVARAVPRRPALGGFMVPEAAGDSRSAHAIASWSGIDISEVGGRPCLPIGRRAARHGARGKLRTRVRLCGTPRQNERRGGANLGLDHIRPPCFRGNQAGASPIEGTSDESQMSNGRGDALIPGPIPSRATCLATPLVRAGTEAPSRGGSAGPESRSVKVQAPEGPCSGA